MYRQNILMFFNKNGWILLVGLLFFSACKSGNTDKYVLEAESAQLIGEALKMADGGAEGGYSISLTKSGEGIKFTDLSASSKLAIRYAAEKAGTISVAINNQPVQKVNVHSSGSMNSSFLNAIVDVDIPSNATLTVMLSTDDVGVNIDQVTMGNGDLGLPPDIWNLPPLQIATGQYPQDWQGLGRVYSVPEWWRDAKFGAWSHWDPQSMPEQGDWYARGMYIQGSRQYKYQLEHFGHPSEYGYKDICYHWVIDRWNPDSLMQLYIEMGAKYFMSMGVHHDNFDCYDSKYQPWNSVNVGPKVDVVGTWEKVARKYGMHFGIGFHDTPARTWGQFMPVRYTSDKTGPMQGVPYDALQTVLDGEGEWWEGMDPADLYGTPHTMERNEPRRPGNDPLLSPFANQFMWRVDDAITKYHPDLIYFDEHAGDSQVDIGVHMGLGFLAPELIANYYNKSMEWNDGKMDVVVNLKGVGGRYNSFQNNPDLLPYVDRSLVKSTEAFIEPEIMAYPFQTETTSGEWHYQKGQSYLDASTVIQLLMQNVSRNGSLLLNVSQHGRGNLDPEAIQISKDVGAWLKVNGEAIYASRPFEVCEEDENAICYTRNDGNVYATLLGWNGGPITLKSLRAGGATLGKVSKVDMLGSDVPLTFVQNDQGLTITPGKSIQPLPGMQDQSLASGFRVLRIYHDKGWFNDDDPGATYPGWMRRCNLGADDYNNDLTFSDTPGDIWSCSFTGSSVSVIAPKEQGAGKIEVQIDGQAQTTADLSTNGSRLPQQVVSKITDLTPGDHTISIINRGGGLVAVDAIKVQ